MEKSGETLTRVSRIFFGLVQADTNPEREKMQEEIAPKLAAHQDEISLDPEAVRAHQEPLRPARHAEPGPGAEAPGRVPVQGVRACRRAAVRRRQGSLRKLNGEETTLSTAFHTKLVAATAAGAVVVDDKASWTG
jgi:peptidyl-dipeptidase Dcp